MTAAGVLRQRAPLREVLRGLAVVLICALWGIASLAQETVPKGPAFSPILVIDEEQLFFGSLFGRRVTRELGTAQRALEAEDRRISAELSAEEDALTEARSTMAPDEFRKAADAFDTKVVKLRAQVEDQGRALAARLDAERQRFRSSIAPVLGQIVQERGAAVILDKREVFASIDAVDITGTAIARIDQILGDGGQLGVPEDPPDTPDTPATAQDP